MAMANKLFAGIGRREDKEAKFWRSDAVSGWCLVWGRQPNTDSLFVFLAYYKIFKFAALALKQQSRLQIGYHRVVLVPYMC
jgi:hypothetical protein